jgi:biotin carboxyl carrier protein
LKLTVEIDGESYKLELRRNGTHSDYVLSGAEASSQVFASSGRASVAETRPGVYSVLLDERSFAVHLARGIDGLEVWVKGRRLPVSVSDARDRSKGHKPSASGPLELRTQMPGKIIRVLVTSGTRVHAGQELVVVEAMKMQNEVRSPKDGVVTKIFAIEGTTVGAGETLVMVE